MSELLPEVVQRMQDRLNCLSAAHYPEPFGGVLMDVHAADLYALVRLATPTRTQAPEAIRAAALEEAAAKMDSINMPTCARIIRALIQSSSERIGE